MGRRAAIFAAAGVAAVFGAAMAQDELSGWWSPDEARTFPARISYPNDAGMVGLVNTTGDIDTDGHLFFESIGSNGRACVTCHQPSDAMSLAAATIAERWEEAGGDDPLFAAVDGANCPDQPQGERASHSLAIERGLFRVAMPWPPLREDGTEITPEFTIEVERDPTGCNLSPTFGLDSREPTISVYRRPRVVANMRYVGREGPVMNAKNIGQANAINPETGRPSSMNLSADARFLSLEAQIRDAAHNQLGLSRNLSPMELTRLVGFERQLYMAQSHDAWGEPLGGEGAPSALGPIAMTNGRIGLPGNNFETPVFGDFETWRTPEGAVNEDQAAFRASVARGYDVFFTRPFYIRDAMHMNTTGIGNPAKRTCATCHDMQMTGMGISAGWVDSGTANLPWADDAPDLPLFKVTCNADAPPHLYLGREIYTHDPGRALASGRCMDVGSIVMGQLRGLSARAPYFSNGTAADLRQVVEFYNRRFDIRFSEQEKQDLVNFLSVL